MSRRATSPRRCGQHPPGVVVKNTFIDICDEHSDSDGDVLSSPHRRNASAPPSPTRPRRGEDSDDEEVDDDPHAIPCYQWAVNGKHICAELAEATLHRRDCESPRGHGKWSPLGSPKKVPVKGVGLGAIFNMDAQETGKKMPLIGAIFNTERQDTDKAIPVEQEEETQSDALVDHGQWQDFGSEDFEAAAQYRPPYHDAHAPAAPPGTFYKDASARSVPPPSYMTHPPPLESAMSAPPPYEPYVESPAQAYMGAHPPHGGYPHPSEVQYPHVPEMDTLSPGSSGGAWHAAEPMPTPPASQPQQELWSQGQRRLSELRARGRMLQEAACIPSCGGGRGERFDSRRGVGPGPAMQPWATGKWTSRPAASQPPGVYAGAPPPWAARPGRDDPLDADGKRKAARMRRPPPQHPGGAAPPLRVGLLDTFAGGATRRR